MIGLFCKIELTEIQLKGINVMAVNRIEDLCIDRKILVHQMN